MTAMYLGIHTATAQQSICILGKTYVSETIPRNKDSGNLVLAISHLLEKQNATFSDIVALTVTTGPGHYLGIRVGITVATMLGVPFLFGQCTLASLVPAIKGLYLSILPARKGQFHVRLFRVISGKKTALTAPFILTISQLSQTLDSFKAPITLCGEIDAVMCENPFVAIVPTVVDSLHLAHDAQLRYQAHTKVPSFEENMAALKPYYGYEAV